MAKIKEISINYGLTKNLGNYESLRLDITLTAVVFDSENTDKVWSELMQEARSKIVDAVKTEEELLRNW